MARLHEIGESEDELPDLSKILVPVNKSKHRVQNDQPSSTEPRGATKARVHSRSPSRRLADRSLHVRPIKGGVETSSGDQQARKQKPLRLAHVNSLLLSNVHGPSKSTKQRVIAKNRSEDEESSRQTPGRTIAQTVDFTNSFVADLQDPLESTDDDTSIDDLSDFIVNDSASETEMQLPRSVKKYRSVSPRKPQKDIENNRVSSDKCISRKPEPLQVTIDLTFPDAKPNPAQRPVSHLALPETGSTSNNKFSIEPFSSLRLLVSPH